MQTNFDRSKFTNIVDCIETNICMLKMIDMEHSYQERAVVTGTYLSSTSFKLDDIQFSINVYFHERVDGVFCNLSIPFQINEFGYLNEIRDSFFKETCKRIKEIVQRDFILSNTSDEIFTVSISNVQEHELNLIFNAIVNEAFI